MSVLGDYFVGEPIGKGSMGRVFAGEHRLLRVPVAIKVLDGLLDPRRLSQFRREIAGVARLAHPGIVTIYDHGVCQDDVGQLPAGSPWFAMEVVDGGTLSTLHIDSWPMCRRSLRQMLAALAHCHARGIIHCDLKPGNVLVATTGTRSGGIELKLSDFGIFEVDPTHIREDTPRRLAGTPRYMAPEQLRNAWRDLGPWTDLYSLGCLAYRMVCGGVPFSAPNLDELVAQHLVEPPPPLDLRFPAPRGLESWIHRLMAKRAGDRFVCAADALRALDSLEVTRSRPGRGEATVVPSSWRLTYDDERAFPPLLEGVGLGLFGVRDTALIGRRNERDLAWNVLRESHALGAPRALVLRGASGVGKSRIASWLTRRAHELGAAEIFRVSHAPEPGPADGLVATVARYLRVEGLVREKALVRIDEAVGRDALAIERLLDLIETDRGYGLEETEPEPTERVIRFAGLQHRHRLLYAFFRAIARERPLLIHIDGGQWAADALSFVRYVIHSGELHTREATSRAMVFVVTVDDDLVDETDAAGAELEALVHTTSAVRTVTLEPLDAAAQLAFVNHLLRLAPALAERIVNGTAGVPLFARQLLGDWVQRGVLAVGNQGVRVVGHDEIPATIGQLWNRRIEHAVAMAKDIVGERDARLALSIAAALGLSVRRAEWQAACARVGIPRHDELVDALHDSGLVVDQSGADGQSWTFTHPMVRAVLEDSARRHGLWAEAHAACAAVFGDAAARNPFSELSVRAGRHSLAAGQTVDALHRLLHAAEHRRRSGDFDGALALLDSRARVLPPGLGAERIQGLTIAARIHAIRSNMKEATRLVETMASYDGALAPWWQAMVAFVTGFVHFKSGKSLESRHHLELALTVYAEEGDDVGIAESELILGKILQLTEPGTCDRHFQAAVDAARRASDVFTYARALMAIGETDVRMGRREAGRRHLERALNLFEELGNPERVAAVLNDLGEVHRFDGNLEEAERCYRRAVHSLESQGSSDAAVPQINVGIVLLSAGRPEEAVRELAAALATFVRVERPTYGQACAAILACARAELADWDGAGDDFETATRMHAQSPLYDRDLATYADQLGRLAYQAGRERLAYRALALAVDQWSTLGRNEEAAAAAKLKSSMAVSSADSARAYDPMIGVPTQVSQTVDDS